MDYATTMLAISHGAVEGNPIADYFVDNNSLHYYKLVGVGIVCIYLIHAAKRNSKSVIRVLWATNSLLGLLCIYNVVAYFIQKYDFALM